MLSICIPVYNFNISNLLVPLNDMALKIKVPYEIIIADDCSTLEYADINSNTAKLVHARYLALKKNIGRAAIRNLLCKEAQFQNLLFLDCDSILISSDFLFKYSAYFNKNVVVCGGVSYQEDLPAHEYLLHWNYGRTRESKPAAERNSFSTRSFMTINFLIPKQILTTIPFNEDIKGYGHEDTFLGIEFFKNNIPVIHIENPVLHSGLDDENKFIAKTEEGIRNLCSIYNMNLNHELLIRHVRVLEVFSLIKRFRIRAIIAFFYKLLKPFLLMRIKKTFSMLALDIYKIGYLCSIYSVGNK